MNGTLVLAVTLGGLVGAPARYVVDRAVTTHIDSEFPWGTLVINTVGAFIFGAVTGLVLSHRVGSVTAALIGTGFCGAFTTFSTFTFETIQLVEDGEGRQALGNVLAATIVGLLAAAAGLAVGLHL